MEWRSLITRPLVLLLALLTAGSVLLLPGLGSFGLWEPPDSWEPVHRRARDTGSGLSRNERERFSRPRSEMLLAEQARRALAGKAGRVEGGPDEGGPSAKAGVAGGASQPGAAATPGQTGRDAALNLPERPPLSQMAVTLGYRIFGVSEWAGRLPLALLGLLVLALTFALLWQLFDRWVAILGGLVLLGLPAFVLQARQLTSEMLPTACGLMAVGGIGLWAAPRVRRSWGVFVALGVGLLGLLGGYFSRGAVLGVLIPALGVLLAMVASRRLWGVGAGAAEAAPQALRGRFWIDAGALLGLVLAIGVGAWAALSAQDVPRYSAFLGETPLVATQVLNFLEMKSNPTELAVFDVMIKQLGFAAFPWIALVPLALVALLWWRSDSGAEKRAAHMERAKETAVADAAADAAADAVADAGKDASERDATPGHTEVTDDTTHDSGSDEKERLDQYGRFLLVGWLLSAILVGTYWILRFGDAGFVALPALAGGIGVLLRDLTREQTSPLRLAALIIAVAALVILLRDFGSFPEALVSTHVHYQLHFPEGISLKWPLRILVLLFGVSTAALLIGRGAQSPVSWPSRVGQWFLGSGLGIGRRLGFTTDGDDAPSPLAPWNVAKAVLLLISLAVAGAGIAWITQRPPQRIGPVVLFAFVSPLVLPLVPMALATLLDALLYGIHVLWLTATGQLFVRPSLLVPEGEVETLRALWGRYLSLHPAQMVLFALPGVGVALLVFFRYFLRGILSFLLLMAAAPLTIVSFLSALSRRGESAPKGAGPAGAGRGRGRSQGKGKGDVSDGQRHAEASPVSSRARTTASRAAVATLLVAPLLLSAYLAWGLVPKLSEHYSYKAIFDTYNLSRDPKRPEPLALWQVATRSPVFYTRGPLLGEEDLKRRYPAKAGSGSSSLVGYLASGWTDSQGASQERVYAIVPAGILGTLDRDTAASTPRVPYYVLDNRNSFYLLLSNRLGRVKRGGRWVAETDQNPLRQVVLDAEPSMGCPSGGRDICPRFSAMLGEHQGVKEPSLEVLGARFPQVIPPGESFTITIYFRVLKKIQTNFKVFIHIDGMGNRVIADHDPVEGRYATSLWLPGRYVVDRHMVPAAATSAVSTPRGVYTIYAGLFQGERRMQVLSGPADKENRIILGRVRVGSRGAGCGQ